MKDNHLLEGLQSAYEAGHSTETALLRIHNDLLCGVEKASAVSLVLLDLSAAFDTVDHSTFLSLLEFHSGIKGKLEGTSVTAFLSRWSHTVCGNRECEVRGGQVEVWGTQGVVAWPSHILDVRSATGKHSLA